MRGQRRLEVLAGLFGRRGSSLQLRGSELPDEAARAWLAATERAAWSSAPSLRRRSGGRVVAPLRRAAAEAAFSALADALAAAHAAALAAVQARESARGPARRVRTRPPPRARPDGRGAPLRADARRADHRTARRAVKRLKVSAARWRAGRVETAWRALRPPPRRRRR